MAKQRRLGTGTIVRYPNRRLYDSEIAAYITLDDVEKQVLAGKRVRIVTKKDDNDITGYVLLQVLSKHAQDGNNRVTIDTLCALIKKPEPGAQAQAKATA
jgi:polyhydroxyalkanoate synthesis repressor PhaR